MKVAIRMADGSVRFQFHHVAQIFDFLLSVGIKPFVELGPMPQTMASGTTTFFYWHMNVTPPERWEEWELLIDAFMKFIISEYGHDEIQEWCFEVWNEPNLSAFWTGSFHDYMRLYEISCNTIKSHSLNLKVGGPATAETGWIDEFLEACHIRSLPVDFVSTHLYPQNEWLVYPEPGTNPYSRGEFFSERIIDTNRNLKNSYYPSASMFLTEWNSLSATNPEHVDWFANHSIDSIESAACIVRNMIKLDHHADGLFWWVITDVFEEAGIPQSLYSGTYGFLNRTGKPKASYWAFKFLKMLSGPILDKQIINRYCGYCATKEAQSTRVILWNDTPKEFEDSSWSDTITFKTSETILGSMMTVRPLHGSGFETWEQMGRPQNPTQVQRLAIESSCYPDSTVIDSSCVKFTLYPGEIAFIEIAPYYDNYIPKELLSDSSNSWNAGLGTVRE
jgi:xylan 1,4-beta-xylosidase